MKINWKLVFKAFVLYLALFGVAIAAGMFAILVVNVPFYPAYYISILTATFLTPLVFVIILYWLRDELILL